MTSPQKAYPEIGWFKERFKVLQITDDQFEFECLMSGKAMVPTHIHKDCDETFTALEGTLTLKFANQVQHLQPPNTITVPMGVVHSLRNQSKDKIRFRASMTPNLGVSSMFEIMIFLKDRYPDKKYSVLAAIYIQQQLNMKEFSTPVGLNYYFETFALKTAFLLAPLFGWPALVKDYSAHIQKADQVK